MDPPHWLSFIDSSIGMNNKLRLRIRFFIIVLLVFGGLSSSAHALNVQLLRPGIGSVRGFRLFSSDVPLRGEVWGGFHFNYNQEPFEGALVGGATPRAAGIVDQFVTMDMVLTYAATSRLNLQVGLPVNLFYNTNTFLTFTGQSSGGAFGDLWLGGTFQIFDALKTKPGIGLAIVPFVTLPTGRESIHFGDQSFI